MQSQSTQAVVENSGTTEYLRQTERVFYRYSNVKDPVDIASHNILLYYLTWFGRDKGGFDFLALVHEFRDEAQLLIVSHQKRTMEAADALYGVTMTPGGSSKVVSQKVRRESSDAEPATAPA